MKSILSKNLILLVIIYLLYVVFSLMTHETLLADDLSKAAQVQQAKGSDFFSFLFSFLDNETMSPRPASGIITALLIYLSKYNINIYFLGLLSFPISCLFLYSILKENVSKSVGALITTSYALSLIASSIQFSVIMLNSNLALIFYLLSFYYVRNKDQTLKNQIISVFFFTLSTLSYEIFIPSILINLYFTHTNRNRLIYLLISAFLILLYRKGIQTQIFTRSYQRENLSSILDFKRDIMTLILILKMFFRDYFFSFYRTFLNVYKITIVEVILLINITASAYFTFLEIEFSKLKKEISNLFKISLLGIIISLSIFFLSTYKPSLFGFENRNLGAVRLYFSIMVICLLMLAFSKAGRKVRAGIVTAYIALIFLSNVSIKNAWIYASDFNNTMFHSLSTDLKTKKYDCISISYETYTFLKNNKNLILREPTFFNYWEATYLNTKNKIDASTKIYNSEQKKCKYIYEYPSRRFKIQNSQ